MNQIYLDSARLLTRVAPLVLVDDTFALKGGTAINLFVRDMPRLSVDLDLVFPDYTAPREEALKCHPPVRCTPEEAGLPNACANFCCNPQKSAIVSFSMWQNSNDHYGKSIAATLQNCKSQ